MTTAADKTEPALAPLRRELLRAAQADAERTLAEARRAAAELVMAAHAEAEGLVHAARNAGTREGEATATRTLTEARAQARTRVLAARRQLLDALRHDVLGRLPALRKGPVYPDLHAASVRRAHDLLGRRALLTEAAGGGVIATAPGRRLDLSLAAVADLAVELGSAEAERLWEP